MNDFRRFASLSSRRITAMAVALLACLASSLAQSADSPPNPRTAAVLHLTNGGYVAGELKNSGGPSRLGWQSPLFAAPFDFDVNLVNAVHFPLPAELPKAVGNYRFELSQGDVLFGSLVSWTGETLELDVPRIGRVHLRQADVHRFSRWRDSADLVYLGPNGMAGWRASAPETGWREEFGHLATAQDADSLRSNFELPPRAAIEFELSWKKKPDFIFALGAGDDDKQFLHAWRFEVWDGDLVIHRETDDADEPAAVQKVASGPGRAHLLVYLDQTEGQCLVYSTAGEKLADLKLTGAAGGVPAGVRLDNKHGDLRLERLRIARWAGALPREVQTDKSRVHRTDGSIVYGRVAGFDKTAGEFLVREEKTETRVAADDIDLVVMPTGGDAEPRAIRASYQDGTQVSGELVKVQDGAVWLAAPGTKQQLRLPVEGLRSLIVLRHQATAAPGDGGPGGVFESEGVRLRGRLVDSGPVHNRPGRSTSCLVWQPLESASASPLRLGASGKIVYREPPPPPVRQPAQASKAGGRMMIAIAGNGVVVRQGVAAPVIAGVVPGVAGQPGGRKPARVPGAGGDDLDPTGKRALHLRSGDTIPCTVTGIDENGILFRTPLSDATFVPHARIKAVELISGPSNASAVRLNKIKRERLLTLPRMQKDSPPTHLIRSKNGDILRGRVLAMDDKKLTVEVRLETREIPRERIAQIIWLHADELGEAAVGAGDQKPAGEKARDDWNPIEEKPGVKQSAIEEQIVRSLDKPTTVNFQELPLEDCLTFLKEYHNINLVIDKAKMADEGVALDEPVTINLEGVALRKILKLLLEPRQLSYVIEDDALKIMVTVNSAGRPAEPFASNPLGAGDHAGMRVQVLRSDGNRLTFFAEKLGENFLSGTSDVLGACRVDLNVVDQLLIGGAIEEAAALLAYHQWKLHHALEPKSGDGASGDGSTGTESALVGKPAPPFELDLLGGRKFRLAETKGRVIVLDFWATWCGPCIQAMPQVDRTVREFADQGVQLIAVNLEETPKQITALLERHKLDLTVALDRDGVVAGRYGATAIPQTVIIDREGNVARVFVGGGPHLGEQLADALRKVLDPDKSNPAKPD